MSRREDFNRILNHQRPERQIIDLGGCPLSSMTEDAMHKFLVYLGFDYEKGKNKFGRIDERILKYLNIDTRSVGTILQPQKSLFKKISETEMLDEWGIRKKYTGLYWDIIENPLKGATIDDLDKYPWPDPETIDINLVERFRNEAKILCEETDYIVCGEHPVYGVFELGCWMCGFDDFLMKMALDEEFVQHFFEIILEYQKKVIELYYGMIGPYIHYTSSGDDFATQTNSFISPSMFREMIKPYFKERIQYTKKFTKAAFLHHSCGNVYSLIPDLIEAGVEILNPIQPVNEQMSPESLKKSYGNIVCFHGGIDTQKLLPFGNKQDIAEEVKKTIRIMGENGGYIFAAAHNLQGDVPPENIEIMFRAAKEEV